MSRKWVVYILQCGDGSLYTGITTDLRRRLEEHSKGKASKCTRSKLPVKCVYAERRHDESSAKKREAEIKSWDKAEKLQLVSGHMEKRIFGAQETAIADDIGRNLKRELKYKRQNESRIISKLISRITPRMNDST